MRSEHFWWFGLALWVIMLVLWRPDPPMSYMELPSASTRPYGFSIFHDLLERDVQDVRRVLGRASTLADDVDVLLVLSPTGNVPESHRADMMDWVSSSDGTLIVAYPVYGDEGEPIASFGQEGMWSVSKWEQYEELAESTLIYMPQGVSSPREVPPFGQVMSGEMTLAEFGADSMLTGERGESAVSVEGWGSGTLIQIADCEILDNRSLGWKRSHLFVAALLDEVGRDKVWAFDESHEGVKPEPSLVVLLGSGRWRPVALQILLLIFFLYWWRTSRIGRPAVAPPLVDVREVTTLARDVGDFYMRAGKSTWALARSLEFLRLTLKGRGVHGDTRKQAEAVVRQAEKELERGEEDMEKHAFLIKKMANCQRMLDESSKGKRK